MPVAVLCQEGDQFRRRRKEEYEKQKNHVPTPLHDLLHYRSNTLLTRVTNDHFRAIVRRLKRQLPPKPVEIP
jgi:hypothetical protein